MRRWSATLLLALGPALPAAGAGGLTARLEVKGPHYRLGEPVEIRVTLANESDSSIANPDGIPLLPHLELGAGEAVAHAAAVPEFDAGSQPRVFLPGTSLLQVVDLAPHFPALSAAGTYTLRFRAGDIESDPIDVIMLPPYDPSLDYRAVFKTDFGEITFDLLEEVAPEHVENFVDLARRGYYDGTLFHFIARGETIVGGDPQGDGLGSPGWSLRSEFSNRPHERGTLSAYRPGPEAPDHGSQFFISLRRAPERDGKFTLFGKLVDGDAALTALENVATSGQNIQPYFRPMHEARLQAVTIRAEARGAAAPEAGGSAGGM